MDHSHRRPTDPHDRDHALEDRLIDLISAEIDNSLSIDMFECMLNSGTSGLASLANAKAVCEGRLLEKAIAVIAAANPTLKVLTQVRLPIRDVALELVQQNDPALYRQLAMEATERTLKTYIADIVLVDVAAQLAYIVDVKRSLSSFKLNWIAELRQRMLAAALVASDLLWREHKRISVKEVRVVILEAAGKRTDLENGIWSLAQLDHLTGVAGATDMISGLREQFAAEVEDNLSKALDRVSATRAGPGLRRGIVVCTELSADGGTVIGASETSTTAGSIRSTHRPDKTRVGVAPPPPYH
jgi:hypothetical protein